MVLARATVDGTGIVRQDVKACASRGEATVLGPERLSTTAAQAALANGASGHAMTIFDRDIEARGFEKMRSVVEVDVTDGRSFAQPSDERYRGGPERPFTRAELHEKFTDCASLVLSPQAIRRALELIESVETITNIRELAQAMVPGA